MPDIKKMITFGIKSLFRDMGDGTHAEVVAFPTVLPEAWAAPATAWDVRHFGDTEVQFVDAPTTPYQPQRSLDGVNFVNCMAYDADGASYATITTAGIYSFDGNGYLKFSAGDGSTLTRRAGA